MFRKPGQSLAFSMGIGMRNNMQNLHILYFNIYIIILQPYFQKIYSYIENLLLVQ